MSDCSSQGDPLTPAMDIQNSEDVKTLMLPRHSRGEYILIKYFI